MEEVQRKYLTIESGICKQYHKWNGNNEIACIPHVPLCPDNQFDE